MGIPANHPAILQALERGLIRPEDLSDPMVPASTPVTEPAAAREDPELVAPVFAPPGTWLIPVATASETNLREWRARSNRTRVVRATVSRCFGPHLDALAVFARHYHAGGTLAVTFTRLGGRWLDVSNLPAALKSVEDAVALTLGADDGDSRWRPEFRQQPGGPLGVQIELANV